MGKSEAATEKKRVTQKDAPKENTGQEGVKAKKPSRSGKKSGVGPEMRHQMIADAAYFRAEKYGHSGDPVEHWLVAEVEIDMILKENRQE